ncbi:amidohydrolase family protein [Streptomyces sp. NBC_00076]
MPSTRTQRAPTEDPSLRTNFGRLAALGLSFDLQIYPHQMEQAAVLARAFPDVRIILDHAGMPISRTEPSLATWREQMRHLARCPNVACKISGIGAQDHHWTAHSIRPVVLGAIEAFGPDRSMFAGNFPVDSLYSTFSRLYSAFSELTADFSADERARLFSGTATETYRLGSAGRPGPVPSG